MRIQIPGAGCPKCTRLSERAETAAAELGIDCEFETITDLDRITKFGVMLTPTLAVDGHVKVSGKVPSVDELKDLLA
ncbi:MAG: thioredoxin family protein [Planctomycetota bacterium]